MTSARHGLSAGYEASTAQGASAGYGASAILLCACLVAMLAFPLLAHAQDNGAAEFRQLPAAIQKHVREVRAACNELNPENSSIYAMSGIQPVDIEGDGIKEILVNDLDLCNSHMAGANCSNRGCDLIIWKRAGNGWRQVFNEHLHNQHVLVDYTTDRLKLIVATIYAGDARCKPDPKKAYTSGMSCDLLVRYRQGRWVWEKVE